MASASSSSSSSPSSLNGILRVLHRRGALSAGDLAAELGTPVPSLASRLARIASLGWAKKVWLDDGESVWKLTSAGAAQVAAPGNARAA